MKVEQFQAGGVLVEMYYLEETHGVLLGSGRPRSEKGIRLSKTPSDRRYKIENVVRQEMNGHLTHWQRVGEAKKAWTYRGAKRIVNRLAAVSDGS